MLLSFGSGFDFLFSWSLVPAPRVAVRLWVCGHWLQQQRVWRQKNLPRKRQETETLCLGSGSGIQIKRAPLPTETCISKDIYLKVWKKAKLMPWGFWEYVQNTIIKLSPAVKIPHKKKKLERFPMGNAWLERKVLLHGLKVNKLGLHENV